VLVVTCVMALVTFAVVQDRVTAAGARRYAAIKRASVGTQDSRVTIENVMAPAIRSAVQWGAAAAGVVIVLGAGLMTFVPRERRRAGER
jgi:hypothetical protein